MPVVEKVEVQRRILVDRELWICLAQLQARPIEAISDDRPNPAAVAIARELLLGTSDSGARWLNRDGQSRTRVVLFPEYAFSSGDWKEIDDTLADVEQPTILIAGFGATKVEELKTWQQSETSHAACEQFFDLEGVPNEKLVNFGCCWIKLPEDAAGEAVFRRTLFCKNWPEQSYEALSIRPFVSDRIGHISFEDCDLFPVICSDLIQKATNDDQSLSAREKITKAIPDQSGKPVLITGSLLQPSSPWTDFWNKAIRGATQCSESAPILVALSNIACDKFHEDYHHDGRRNLTGVYLGRTPNLSPTAVCNIRGYLDADMFGYPLRCGATQLVMGMARFGPYRADSGSHAWRFIAAATPRAAMGRQNLLLDSNTGFAYELIRHIPRVTRPSPTGPIRLHLVDSFQSSHMKEVWWVAARRILEGPEATEIPSNYDPLSDDLLRRDLELGAVALNDLKTDARFDWELDTSQSGQLRATIDVDGVATTVQVAVWSNARKSQEAMLESLLDLAGVFEAYPPLAVFGRGADIDLNSREFRRRQAGTTGPVPDLQGLPPEMSTMLDGEVVRSTTELFAMRKVAALPLSSLLSLRQHHINTPVFSRSMQEVCETMREHL